MKKVNLAIQVLPMGQPKDDAYDIVDAAITVIQASGFPHKVCPFETVIEAPYDKVFQLLDEIQSACKTAGAKEILINMKLQRNFEQDVFISEKSGKYER